MNAEHFAEFWRRQGHRVLKTQEAYWYNASSAVFVSSPYHRIIQPSARAVRFLQTWGPAAVLRYPSDPGQVGPSGGLFVCNDRDYDWGNLHVKARNATRRGREKCRVEQVEFGYLAAHGYELVMDCCERQGRLLDSVSREQWIRYCRAGGDLAGFEAWGAFVGNKLAAQIVAASVEDCYSLLHQSSLTATLDAHPNNAICFTVTRHALARNDVRYVSYGWKSIEETPSLDRFKYRMGYELRPFSETFVLHPALKALLVCGGVRVIRHLGERNRASDFWRKAARVVDLATQSGSLPAGRPNKDRRGNRRSFAWPPVAAVGSLGGEADVREKTPIDAPV